MMIYVLCLILATFMCTYKLQYVDTRVINDKCLTTNDSDSLILLNDKRAINEETNFILKI